jgi:hypothetical protein
MNLAYVKMAIGAIRFLGRSERSLDKDTTVAALRLIWRTLIIVPTFDSLDQKILWTGALESRWQRAAQSSRSECDSNRPMSHFVHPTALEYILETPSPQNQALLRWILRHDVFVAINGFTQLPVDVPIKWRQLQSRGVSCTSYSLLLVGHKSTLDINITNDFEDELVVAVRSFKHAGMEQRNGSTIRMPLVP